jgi:hypothetical protein
MNRWDSRGRAARWTPRTTPWGRPSGWPGGDSGWCRSRRPTTRSPPTPARRPSAADGARCGSRPGRCSPSSGAIPGAGVGLVLGPAVGVVGLEVDDRAQARPLLTELFPGGSPATMGWDSSRGEHRLFRWDDRLARAGAAVVHLAGGAVELRLGADGKQLGAVCQPSPGADGQPRCWNGAWEIAPCPEVLVAVVARLAAARVPRDQPLPARRPQPRGPSARYALAALEREVARVRTAGPGTRNSTLNRAAFRLGQLVATRALDRAAVEVALTGAALAPAASKESLDMKPRPLAVDPKSFERSGVNPPGNRARLGLRSVLGRWPPQSDREEPSSSTRARPCSGRSPRPLPSRHMSDRLLRTQKTRSDSMFRKADPDQMLSSGTTFVRINGGYRTETAPSGGLPDTSASGRGA